MKLKIISNNEASSRKDYFCPKCNAFLLSTKDGRMTGRKSNYCMRCGKKIHWERIKLETMWQE